jgi:hypothetical protein
MLPRSRPRKAPQQRVAVRILPGAHHLWPFVYVAGKPVARQGKRRWVLEQENQQGTQLRLAELQVLGELVRERRATTPELALLLQRTDARPATFSPAWSNGAG